MRCKAVIALGTVALLVACGGGSGARPKGAAGQLKEKKPSFEGAPPVVPTLTRDLRGALVARDFARLEARLEEIQGRWTQDHRTDTYVLDAYTVFSCPDESFAPHFDAWVASGSSPAAHTARGYYRSDVAFEHRGTKFAGETSEQAFEAYARTAALARADLKEALSLDPTRIAAYWELVSMEHVDPDERRRLFDEALKLDPASAILRRRYLHLLQPKWGGSFEQIAEVVNAAQDHVAANPKLKGLLGFRAMIEADGARSAGDFDEAERLMTSALQNGEFGYFYSERADVRVRRGDFKGTVEDCDRALAISPEVGETLRLRAQAYVNLRKTDRALLDLDVAVEIDPTNAYARYQRGWIRCSKGDFAAALEDAVAATAHDPSITGAWGKAGYCLIRLDRPAESVPYLTEAIAQSGGEERKRYLFHLAAAHYLARDDRYVTLLQEFVDACGPTPGRALAQEVGWATKALAAPPETRWELAKSNPVLK